MGLFNAIRRRKAPKSGAECAQLKVGQLECNSLKVKHNFELGSFTATYKPAEDLGADEFDMVEISMIVEEEFDVVPDEDALKKVSTVAELCQLIENG